MTKLTKALSSILSATIFLSIVPAQVNAVETNYGANEFSYTLDFDDGKIKDNVTNTAEDIDVSKYAVYTSGENKEFGTEITGTSRPTITTIKDSSLQKNVLRYIVPGSYKQSQDGLSVYSILKIPVPKVSLGNRSYTMEMKIKLPTNHAGRQLRGVGALGSGNTVYLNGLFRYGGTDTSVAVNAEDRQDCFWAGKTSENGNASKDNIYNNVKKATENVSGNSFFKISTDNYVIYKWDIKPESKTFKFSYSTDDGVTWTKPYDDTYMLTTGTNSNKERFSEPGVFPTGSTLPSYIDSVLIRTRLQDTATDAAGTYDISYITLKSTDNLELTNSTISVDDKYFEADKEIKMDFNLKLKSESVTKETFKLVKTECDEDIALADDVYTPILSDDGKSVTVKLKEGTSLEKAQNYKLTVDGITANNIFSTTLDKALVFNFRTLVDYEALNVVSTSNGSMVDMSFNFVDYVKKNKGGNYVLIASLVEKSTNTTYDIKVLDGTSEQTSDEVYKDNVKTFNLTQPRGFDTSKFETRLYIFNSMKNSKALHSVGKYSITE